MSLIKRFPLNAKAIKKALTIEGIRVYSCRRGTGSTKNATYIYVKGSDTVRACEFLSNIGVIDCLGKPLKKLGRISDLDGKINLGACYLSEEMYNELNA